MMEFYVSGADTWRKKMAKEMRFYDVKKKKAFSTSKYSRVTKGQAIMLKAKAPSGCDAYRIVGRKK